MTDSAYRITIEGELDDLSTSVFPDVAVERCSGSTVLQTTTLDQAALNGVLDRLRLIGAALVEVRRAGVAAIAPGADPSSVGH